MVETSVSFGITVSGEKARKVAGLVQDLRRRIEAATNSAARNGVRIDPRRVDTRLARCSSGLPVKSIRKRI
jgi:hypothetical protein